MPHPTYSLDLAPSDYYLFLSKAHLNNQEEEKDSVKEFFALRDKNLYQYGIKELAVRWLYPSYSLDLVHLDYYLFQLMAYFLHSQHFNNQKEVATSVKEFFAYKDKNW